MHLWKRVIILELFQQPEKDTKNVSMVAILKHSDHRGIQIFEDELTFLVLANFVQIIYQESGKKLLN